MLTWQFFFGYWATWTPEKKITLKKRSIYDREEMASHNSYNYCLSECCTAQVAGYRVYLLHFFIKRTTATGLGMNPITCVSAVSQDAPHSHISSVEPVTLRDVAFIFLSAYFLWWIYRSINPKEQQHLMLELFVPVPRAAGGAGAATSLRLFMAELMLWLHSPLQAKEGMDLPWGFLFL